MHKHLKRIWLIVPAILSSPLSFLFTTPVLAQSVGLSSCSGIGTPLTKIDISNRAAPGTNIENAFESFALQSVNLQKNTVRFRSDARRAFTGGRFSRVEPDGVTFALLATTDGNFRIFRRSVFADAKTSEGTIDLSDGGDYQALGFIDALTNSPAGLRALSEPNPLLRPTPALIYLTPLGTIIGNSIIEDATREGVAIFQHVACNNPNGALGIDDMVMGIGIALNPTVYTNRAPLNSSDPTNITLPAGQPGTVALIPSGDDDPPVAGDPPPPSDPPLGLCFISTEQRYEPCGDGFSPASFAALAPFGQEFPSSPSDAAAVPEPTSTVAVLAVGAWVGVSWRKRKSEKQLPDGNIT